MANRPPNNGLRATAHVGDRSILLAFDLDASALDRFAGFAVHCTPPSGKPYWLLNRIGFDQKVTKDTTAEARKLVPTVDAPYQMFHWVHFPPTGPGRYDYEVYARYFTDDSGTKLTDVTKDPKVELSATIAPSQARGVTVGMCRGYVSSQAFIDHFGGNPPELTPNPWSPDASIPAPLEKKYAYLGAHARELVFDFLDDVKKTKGADLDVFAYDFDEPEVIQAIAALAKSGRAVRLFQDNSVSHVGPKAEEPKAAAFLELAGAKAKFGKFARFAHDKVFIKREGGKATRVLTGSANFSIRGLYVQANSILVFEQETGVPPLYGDVFDTVWSTNGDTSDFKKSAQAAQWFPVTIDGQSYRFSFAPHKEAFPLTDVGNAIENAKSSVFFAIMETSGGGDVMSSLKKIVSDKQLLTLGTIEQKSQLAAFRGDDATAQVVSFAFLNKEAPAPFRQEVDAGQGMHIHHKFVVCDFNGASPVVYCGSSNLAAGGETSNGDNLIEIRDRAVVTAYAVEAIRLFDHYRFRSRQANATKAKPLGLQRTHSWADAFYDESNLKCTERLRLIGSAAEVVAGQPAKKLTVKKPAAKPATERRKTPRAKTPPAATRGRSTKTPRAK